MTILTEVLYWISSGLLVPVIVMLLIAFGYTLLLIGDLYGLFAARLRIAGPIRDMLARLEQEPVRGIDFAQALPERSRMRAHLMVAQQAGWSEVHCEKALRDFEMSCRRDLEAAGVLVRVGPMLGLMGTLIPMGPALVSLAGGDLSGMATNMQVAFSTTVIGLFVGAIAFVAHTMKRRWYATDAHTLEFVMDRLMAETAGRAQARGVE